MSEENKSTVPSEGMKQENGEAMARLRNADGVYVFMSVCTRMPYVYCDSDTYDDAVILYYTEEDAQREGKKLIEQKIPIQIARVEKAQMLGFFSSLYPIGVNGIAVNRGMEDEILIQLNELVRRPDPSQLPEGKILVENPQLHLTALYFMQEMRRQKEPKLTEEMKELQEEILVNYGRGKFIVAVHKENGIPLLKQKDGDAYQPIFTDILEFKKFNKENQFKNAAIDAQKIPQILVEDAKGVVINPYGVNLQIPVARNHNSSGK